MAKSLFRDRKRSGCFMRLIASMSLGGEGVALGLQQRRLNALSRSPELKHPRE